MGLRQGKKIVIISSGQPSLNPRLVKEADALAEEGYQVTVLYAYWNDWGTKFDKELIASKKWEAVCIGGDPYQKKTSWFISLLIHKLAKTINQKTGGKYWADLAMARASYFLIREAKKCDADIYIGHNLGALPATVKAAKSNKKLCGFDAEDFHRFEMSDNETNPDVILKTTLENRYFPYLNYLTASSPLIAENYQQLFPDKKPVAVLNVFPKDDHIKEPLINRDKPVKLLWFSQTIGPSRGIEDIINAIQILRDHPFELHLLGYLSAETRESFIDPLIAGGSSNIYFHDPVPPNELTSVASDFDIGLALEPAFSTNNNLALSNKIFTYLQAGLAVVVSDTAAQLKFLMEYPSIGKAYPKGNATVLADTLLRYHQNRVKLFETRKTSFDLARQKLNWETESQALLALVEKTLNRY